MRSGESIVLGDVSTPDVTRLRSLLAQATATAGELANSGKSIRVARDPHPPSVDVQRTVDRLTKAADRQTAAIKAKQSSS
jgi:hypothetical protein